MHIVYVAAALLLAVSAPATAAPVGTILLATPAYLETTPSNVTLDWSGLSGSGPHVIGIFQVGEGMQPLAVVGIPSTASGSVQVEVVNIRRSVYFVLCAATSCANAKDNVATSNEVSIEEDEITQVRLAATTDPNALTVTFTTQNAFTPPMVRLGSSREQMNTFFSGVSVPSYTIDDMCAAPASDPTLFFDAGHQNVVNITGLQAGVSYFYQVGGQSSANGTQHWSDVLEIISLSPAGAGQEVSAVVFADMGVYVPYTGVTGGSSYPIAESSVRWIEELISESTPLSTRPNLAVHIGDISYGRGYPFVWEWFMNSIENIASQVPYMVGIGNHEYDWPGQPFKPSWSSYGTDSAGECGVVYSARFNMPPPAAPFQPPASLKKNTKNLWYSFNQGPIHYLMASTEHDFTESSPQNAFINADLAALDRTQTPWVVFMGHRPMYTLDTPADHNFSVSFQQIVEPVLLKYHVDVALWGHMHQYTRSCGIVGNGVCGDRDEDGIVHVIIGNAGNDYQVPWYHTDNNHFPEPDWLVFRTMDFGISSITANATTFHFQARGWKRNILHDEFILQK